MTFITVDLASAVAVTTVASARWRSVDCFMIGMAAQLILYKHEPARKCVSQCVFIVFQRFDVADMGDFIRSPQFAGTLRREPKP